jgi:flavin reductase (DIM6/NTAB) family NADH-FMN oxidoreductase RutF
MLAKTQQPNGLSHHQADEDGEQQHSLNIPRVETGYSMGVPLDAFHHLIGQLDYPMYIVTAAADGRRAGCLVGFATQCSLKPARLMVCISKANHTHDIAIHASVLAVHFPRGDDLSLARLFGETTGDDIDKFGRCAWHTGPGDVPILEDVRGWVVGRVLEHSSAGDHAAFLLELTDAQVVMSDHAPLSFRQARDFEPGHPV